MIKNNKKTDKETVCCHLLLTIYVAGSCRQWTYHQGKARGGSGLFVGARWREDLGQGVGVRLQYPAGWVSADQQAHRTGDPSNSAKNYGTENIFNQHIKYTSAFHPLELLKKFFVSPSPPSENTPETIVKIIIKNLIFLDFPSWRITFLVIYSSCG